MPNWQDKDRQDRVKEQVHRNFDRDVPRQVTISIVGLFKTELGS